MTIQPFFLDKLQSFRDAIQKPFFVNHAGHKLRGWRSWKENLLVDGRLYHPQGLAADVTVHEMSIMDLARAAKSFGFHGVGLYDTWVHVDCRPRLSAESFFTWDYRTIKEGKL